MIRRFRMQSCMLIVARLLSPFISYAEAKIFNKFNYKSKNYPIFIIGSPRSGSTVLYQILTHTLDCLYIDNLIYAFFNNLPFGFWLSNKLFKNSSHNSFDSEFGNTKKMHSPSECGGFWYRWFPRDRDFINCDEFLMSSMEEIRYNLYVIMNKYEKNIIFKNLNAGQRIRVLHKIFPDAKFIFIRRDPFYTVQSLLKAWEKNNEPGKKWWSVKPSNYNELIDLPLCEKLVAQVFYLERQILEDLKNVPAQNVFEINYLDYGKRFDDLLSFAGCKIRISIDIADFSFLNKITLDYDSLTKIKNEMQKYDWSSLGYE